MAQEIVLFIHIIGFGLLAAIQVAGLVLEIQYRKAVDLPSKALILRLMRPVGLLSPLAIVIMLITGGLNMHLLDIQFSMFEWLRVKIVFFILATVVGAVFGVISRKRGKFIAAMVQGTADAEAEKNLHTLDKLIWAFSFVMPIVLAIILFLTVEGRLGAQ